MKTAIYKSRLLAFIFTCILVGCLTSCSDDGDPTTTNGNQDNLVGVWNVEDLMFTGTVQGIPATLSSEGSGTITFNSNGSGKEDYSYEFLGTTVKENDNFTWISNSTTITFDLGDVDQNTWSRQVNESNEQRGSLDFVDADAVGTIVITLKR